MARYKREDLNILDCLFGDLDLGAPPKASMLRRALGSFKSVSKYSTIIEQASLIQDLSNIPYSIKGNIEATYHGFNPLEKSDHVLKYRILEFEEKDHQIK